MNLQEKASELSARIKELSKDEKRRAESALPDGCYFLDKDTVVCFPRGNGDARYPYSADGFNLWAYSSGYITINESTFYAVLPADDGKEPYLNFYAGKPVGGGSFVPVSLLGIARSPSEGEVQRYTVYTPQAVYYLTETPFARFCVRIFTASDKRVCFSVSAENLSEGILDTYLSAYFNCFLMHAPCENPETKWFKQCKTAEGGFVFFSVEDLSRTQHLKNYGILSRSVSGGGVYTLTSTTSRTDYTGGKNNYLAAAVPLFSGAFGQCRQATKFTDTAVAGDHAPPVFAKRGSRARRLRADRVCRCGRSGARLQGNGERRSRPAPGSTHRAPTGKSSSRKEYSGSVFPNRRTPD